AALLKRFSNLRRLTSQVREVVVRRKVENRYRAGRVPPGPASHLGNEWMTGIEGSGHLPGLVLKIPREQLLDRHQRNHLVGRASENDLRVHVDVPAELYRQRDGNGKECAVGEPHFLDDPPVIPLPHEAVKGREGTG